MTLLPVEGSFRTEGGRTVVESPSALTDPDYFVWGGSVVKGDDGKYHMFYSIFNAGSDEPKFSDSWLLTSKIAYAVSDYPDRSFTFQKVVLYGAAHEGDSLAWDAQGVHNPHIKKFNGKYYLYYIGSSDPGIQPPGSPGENLNKRNRIQQNQFVSVIAVDRLKDLVEGNFSRPQKPLLKARTRVKPDNILNPSPKGTEPMPDNIIVVNPTVEFRPSDGKYLMYFKGNLYDPGWRGVHGVALADHPDGPFLPQDEFVFDFRLDDGRIASAEDPYVWYHPGSELFYAVFKDFTGKITGADPGLAIMHSYDGIEWIIPDNPLFAKKQIMFKNGQVLKLSNFERPQFLVNKNGVPIAFYAACSIEPVGSKKDGSTFNMQFSVDVQ